jgi:succinate-semialdehyde dehydrogenase/glutarate-semialdehyde dehydrogenase
MTALAPDLIECVAPATGEVIGHVPVTQRDEVRSAVARAKAAQTAWAALSVKERARRLLVFREKVVAESERLVDVLVQECGKPRQEALVHEVALLCHLITHYARRAPALLKPRSFVPDLLKYRKSRIRYEPRGVIGIISPWNFPLLIPFADAMTALFAGNAVVVKPSEHAPLIALELKKIWDESGLEGDLLQVVPGRGETGQALIEGGVAKVVFTGGVETGRRVAASCGQALVECVLELGGKAPAIVCDDADVELAARAIAFGAFFNAGQACISVERVLAHETIYQPLVERLVEHTRALRLGGPEGQWDVGPIIFSKQTSVAETLIQDALERGAELRIGGRRAERRGDFFEPTVLANCNEGMRVKREEIFGPVVPVMKVSDDAHALTVANSIPLGLNAYVFSETASRARDIASRLEVGSVVINDMLSDYGAPEAPFGGVKNSGYGRTHGDTALRAMCTQKHVSEARFTPPVRPWFPYTEKSESVARRMLSTLFSKKSLFSAFVGRI